jgi:hypothetical protein
MAGESEEFENNREHSGGKEFVLKHPANNENVQKLRDLTLSSFKHLIILHRISMLLTLISNSPTQLMEWALLFSL